MWLILIFALIPNLQVTLGICPRECSCVSEQVTCTKSIPEQITGKNNTHLIIANITSDYFHQLSQKQFYRYHNITSLKLKNVNIKTIEHSSFMSLDLNYLAVTNNHISHFNTNALMGCDKLNTLDLQNNKIEEITGTFENLKNLKTLDLSKNNIKIFSHKLPAYLHVLNLENNQIEQIDNMTHDTLQEINLCGNNMTSFSQSKITMQELSKLCLGGSRFNLDGGDFANLQVPNLKSLVISGKNESRMVTISNTGNKEIKKLLTNGLISLKFSHCIFHLNLLALPTLKQFFMIKSEVIVPRSRGKIDLPQLTIMDMSGSPMLAQLFKNSRTKMILSGLHTLKLSRCDLEEVSQMLINKVPNLTNLDISYNPLYCAQDKLGWIQEYNITLLNPKNTVCAQPQECTGQMLVKALNFSHYWDVSNGSENCSVSYIFISLAVTLVSLSNIKPLCL